MTRVAGKSDRDFSADPPGADAESPAWLIAHSEIAELFDATARRRFGQLISAAVLKSAKQRRCRRRRAPILKSGRY
jgi:hypothetical protein